MISSFINFICLQATNAAPAATGAADPTGTTPQPTRGAGMSWIFLLAIVLLFVWMFWKQSRDQKKRKAQIASLGKGSKVVTNAGIYGKICEVEPTTFIVEIAPSVKITIDKGCVFPAAEQPEAQK